MLEASELQKINNYLSRYWAKYPAELECDPPYKKIIAWINNGGKYFLKDNIFIIYSVNDKLAAIMFYWCDMKDIPRKILKNTLKNHKEFINSLPVPAYSRAIKELFDRKYLVSYDDKTKLWRWL